MPAFKARTPTHCPGAEAIECNATIYRACDAKPPTAEDFTSHAHSTKKSKFKRADPAKCVSWGLSVWISEQDAAHARELHDWLKPKIIVRCEVQLGDGRLAQTGKAPHHTFWPYEHTDLLSRSVVTSA